MNENQSKYEQWILNLQERKKEAKFVRKIVFISMAVLILLIVGTGIGGYLYVSSALEPVDEEDDTPVTVEIPIGSSVNTITSTLEENNIVKNASVYKYYLKFNNESDFQAGTYDLMPSMTLAEITESLKTGTVYHEPIFNVTIPEGLRLEEIAAIIETNTSYTEEEFMEKVNDPDYVASLQEKFPELISDEVMDESIRYPLEGYLFPATYPYYEENPSLDIIITQMVQATNDAVIPYLDSINEFSTGSFSPEDNEMTVHKALTFSSLLEEEATESTDRAIISGIFYNRLEDEMPLQTDPTVLYALGEWRDRVLFEDLEVDHPYNTYQNTGLPPGPIASSGTASLEATLNPESTNYYYFLAAAEDGVVYYSETLEEHEQKAEQYIYNAGEDSEEE
ncbi:endolytic transglycosylase MltG [Jeotgalibacillus proteolyticus]|uniref:Endolytic murein transglycosylase n=1 Tax=Jeotgalibacillus proteolyticus TaxID=2082395 RepID=A0A2S5GES0_9BACL|nr:endolytic transglycosylase MltG [Jeotgalibacillus proteolyticus]PPA71496.1 endolytic transglycosylase MltG [Jeotgalibacillus proteolyticus]